MCCKKKLPELHLKKICLYSTYSSFLVINICNHEKVYAYHVYTRVCVCGKLYVDGGGSVHSYIYIHICANV